MEGCLHLKVLYTTLSHRKRLMRADEIHKFSDGTLNKIYNKLEVILRDNKLGFNNKGMEDRKWIHKDRKRTQSIMEKIEKMLKERRRFRRLEFFVRGRRNKTNYRFNKQVKDNKIDLLVQQYKQLCIPEDESIDSGFVKFNTIVTSLKALDKNFASKNFVRKFLRALHPKWRAKVTTIEESKDLSSLSLDELIGNLKVHEMVMEKDSQLVGDKREKVKSLVSKTKKKSSDDETLTSESEDAEYVMAVENFRKFIRRR
ncbi:hypothetical protein Tco_1407506, partial [Tanacetum coccineum]